MCRVVIIRIVDPYLLVALDRSRVRDGVKNPKNEKVRCDVSSVAFTEVVYEKRIQTKTNQTTGSQATLFRVFFDTAPFYPPASHHLESDLGHPKFLLQSVLGCLPWMGHGLHALEGRRYLLTLVRK